MAALRHGVGTERIAGIGAVGMMTGIGDGAGKGVLALARRQENTRRTTSMDQALQALVSMGNRRRLALRGVGFPVCST